MITYSIESSRWADVPPANRLSRVHDVLNFFYILQRAYPQYLCGPSFDNVITSLLPHYIITGTQGKLFCAPLLLTK